MRILKLLGALAVTAVVGITFGAAVSMANWTGPQEVFPVGSGYFGLSTAVGGKSGSRLVVRTSGDGLVDQERLIGRWVEADGTMSAATPLSAPSGVGPRISALESSGNASGDACLAWIEGDWTWDGRLRARVIDRDREAGSVVDLSETDQYFDGPPKIGIDGAGRCVIVWSEPNRNEDGWLLKRRTISTKGAGPEVTIRIGRNPAPYPGQLAVAPNGLAALVVVTSNSVESEYEYRYYACRFTVDSAATNVVPVASEIGSGAYLANPVISMDVFGRSVVGWFEEVREPVTSARVKTARITPLGIVIPDGAIADAKTTWLNLQLTTNRHGRGAISWDEYAPIAPGQNEGEGLHVQAFRVSSSSGAFGDEVAVEPPIAGNWIYDPHMQATDASGDTYFAVLRGSVGEAGRIAAAKLSRLDHSDGTVTDRASVDFGGEGFAQRQSMTAGTCGKAFAAFSWVQAADPWPEVPEAAVLTARSDRDVSC